MAKGWTLGPCKPSLEPLQLVRGGWSCKLCVAVYVNPSASLVPNWGLQQKGVYSVPQKFCWWRHYMGKWNTQTGMEPLQLVRVGRSCKLCVVIWVSQIEVPNHGQQQKGVWSVPQKFCRWRQKKVSNEWVDGKGSDAVGIRHHTFCEKGLLQ